MSPPAAVVYLPLPEVWVEGVTPFGSRVRGALAWCTTTGEEGVLQSQGRLFVRAATRAVPAEVREEAAEAALGALYAAPGTLPLAVAPNVFQSVLLLLAQEPDPCAKAAAVVGRVLAAVNQEEHAAPGPQRKGLNVPVRAVL